MRLSTPSCGLAAEHISTAHCDKYFTARCNELFKYDATEVKNPAGTMRALRSCRQNNWGLCNSDILLDQCKVDTTNLYRCIMVWKYTRQTFPLMLKIEHDIADVSCWRLLGDTFGNGDSVFLLHLKFDGDLAVLERVAHRGRPLPIVSTGQMTLRSFIQASADKLALLATDISSFRLSVYAVVPLSTVAQ